MAMTNTDTIRRDTIKMANYTKSRITLLKSLDLIIVVWIMEELGTLFAFDVGSASAMQCSAAAVLIMYISRHHYKLEP